MAQSPESGFAYHKNRQELHGVTVVVTGVSGTTWVGRFHEQNAEGVVLKDVGIHDGSAGPLESWLDKSRKFGIRVDERAVVVPAREVVGIERLI